MTLGSRTTLAALVAAVFVIGACSDNRSADDASSGGCYGPWLENDAVGEPPVGPAHDPVATIRPGRTLTFYGHGYTSTCHDAGEGGGQRPLGPVELTVTFPGGEMAEFGTFTPRVDEDGTDVGFVAQVAVPSGTPAGIALVRDDRSPTTEYRFAVDE